MNCSYCIKYFGKYNSKQHKETDERNDFTWRKNDTIQRHDVISPLAIRGARREALEISADQVKGDIAARIEHYD